MTLTELAEPIFQYLCRLNRSARKGTKYQLSEVRGQIRALLDDMSEKSRGTPGLSDQAARIRPSLIYFLDWMIYKSRLPFATNWNNLAEEEDPPVFDGAHRFFVDLESALSEFDKIPRAQKEAREAGENLLMIYHTCLGFGFEGAMEDSPADLENIRREMATRLGVWGDRDDDLLCPQALQHTDKTPLSLAPLPTIMPMLLGLLGAVAVLVSADAYLFYKATGNLTDSLHQLNKAASAMNSPDNK